MGKPNCDDSQLFDRTSSSISILTPPPPPTPVDLDMNWHMDLSRSDPSLQTHANQFINRLAATAYNSSSYKVSIGHETVNITEIARQHESPSDPIVSNERRRILAARKGVNTLSLCFMCFVSATLILISISIIHLLFKTNNVNNSDIIPYFLQSANFTPGFIYVFSTPMSSGDTIANMIVPIYDRTIRDLATVVCLLIVVLNCFCLLVFSIEIYLGCNMPTIKQNSYRSPSFLFSSSTLRFIAICSFYASIPALILVMCLFILLNMSLIPAIISLVVLGFGLIFILITLLTYFSIGQNQNISIANGKSTDLNPTIYHPNDDDIDLAKADELSTLV